MVYEYELPKTKEDEENKIQPFVSIEIPFWNYCRAKSMFSLWLKKSLSYKTGKYKRS